MPSTSSKTYYQERKKAAEDAKAGKTSGSGSSSKANDRKKLADRVADPGKGTGQGSSGKYQFDSKRMSSEPKATKGPPLDDDEELDEGKGTRSSARIAANKEKSAIAKK